MCPATCAESVSPAQYVPSPIRRDRRDGAAVVSPFRRPHAKHTRIELPSTRLPCSSFRPLWDLTCLYVFLSSLQQHMEVIYILSVSRLRPMIKGLNVLGYQSYVLQRCHSTCGHEASSHLTLSATEAKIKRPGFVKNQILDSALVIYEVTIVI